MSWIRGRFEGTTVGEPVDGSDAEGAVRRYALTLHSGSVQHVEHVPDPGTDRNCEANEIRQDRLRRVELPGTLTGGKGGERTLFDVRIRDFDLRHPVEANGRSYATIVGTIFARLVPEPEPAFATAAIDAPLPSAPESSVEARPPAVRIHTASEPSLGHRETQGLTAADQISILQWSLAILFLLAGSAAIGFACGVQTAALWAAPVSLVLLARRFVRPPPISTPALQWWIGGGAVLFQLAVLSRPLDAALQLGCRTPIRDDLLWLAAPIAVAALVRSRLSLYATTLVWTGVLCTWCSQLDGTCTADAHVLPPATAAAVAPKRTDADGRWPVMPPAIRPGGPAPSSLSGGGNDGADGSPGVAQPLPGSNGGAATSAASAPAARVAGSRRSSTSAPEPDATGPIEAVPRASTPPGASRRSAVGPASPGRSTPSTSGGKGGWIAPDHRRTPRQMLLISVEQANRTPQAFFSDEGGRRVYLPTDPIFDPGSANISQTGGLQLTRLAALLNLHPERRVALDVHTDAAGAPETQRRLSDRRATALVDWLVDRGHLEPDQLQAGGLGGSRPIVPPDGSYKDQKPNRRIEVRLVD